MKTETTASATELLSPPSLLSRASASSLASITAALLIACVVLSFLTDRFLVGSNIENILLQSSVVGIAAVGGTFVVITAGIDLSIGSVIALSAMLGSMWVSGGADPTLGLVAIVAIAAAIGMLNGFSVVGLKLTPFIVTLAVLGMGRGITLYVSQGQTVYGLPAAFTWLGEGSLLGLPVPIILMIVAFVIGHAVLAHTVFGHQVYAVGGNREAARLAGINDNKVIFLVYVIAGAAAGLAAITLTGRLGSATPDMGNGLELQVIAAIVIGGTSLFGGKGNMLGTAIGVLLIGVINNGLILLNVDAFLIEFMQGALIFVAVLLDSYNTRRLARARG